MAVARRYCGAMFTLSGQVKAGTIVNGNSADKGSEVFDRVILNGNEQDVANASERVGKQDELKHVRPAISVATRRLDLQGHTFDTCLIETQR